MSKSAGEFPPYRAGQAWEHCGRSAPSAIHLSAHNIGFPKPFDASTTSPQRAVSTASFARAVMKTQLTSLTTSYKRCHSHAWHAHAQNASDYPYRPPQSRLVHKSRISYTCSSLSSSDRLPHLNTVSVYRSMGGGGMYVVSYRYQTARGYHMRPALCPHQS